MPTPQMIQHVSTSQTLGVGPQPSDQWRIRLIDGAQAGNLLVLGLTTSNTGNPTYSVADDHGNTWVQGTTKLDTTNGQNIYIFYALNAIAGTRVISVTNNGGSGVGYWSGVITEFSNIATSSAADGNNGNFATSVTITAGSLTPSQTGDLIYQYAVRDQVIPATSFTAGTVGANPNTSWQLLSADVRDGHAAQWTIYTDTAAINPTMTMAPSNGFVSVALAFKTAAAGTPAPLGIRIATLHHLSQPRTISSPFTAQVPCVGNLLVAAFSCGYATMQITGITDSAGNNWQSTGAPNTESTNNLYDTSQIWYCVNNGPSATLTVTVTYQTAPTVTDGTIFFYDVVNADPTSPFDLRSVSNGNQTVAGDLTAPPAITPATAFGLIIFEVQFEFNSATSCTVALFDSNDFDNEPLNTADNNDQNGGWAHYYNPDTATVGPLVWSFQNTTDALSLWTGYAAAFKGNPIPPLQAFVGEPKCGNGILSA